MLALPETAPDGEPARLPDWLRLAVPLALALLLRVALAAGVLLPDAVALREAATEGEPLSDWHVCTMRRTRLFP